MTEQVVFNGAKLKLGWRIALALGVVSFLIGLIKFDQFSKPELVPIVIIFAVSAIIFSSLFFILCLVYAPGLGRFIEREDTTIEGPTVKTVTSITSSGNADTDRWVGRYVFTRNLIGLSIIPLLTLAGLFLFG